MRTGFVLLYLIILSLSLIAILATIDLRRTARNKQRIGETIVICRDTLTIKDYNVSYRYYILSNGLIYECK